MKKIFTLLLLFIISINFAQQAPQIESTYFPVRNTSVKQIWDTTPGSLNVPTTGPNQVWDYSFTNGQFLNVVDTFVSKTVDAAASPYKQYFPSATHAGFVRTPFKNISDSLYIYFNVSHDGVFALGGFNTQNWYDSTIINTKVEYYYPTKMTYPFYNHDTSFYTAYINNYNNLNIKAKVKGRKVKTFETVGYGTLKLPSFTYNNVLQVRELIKTHDSIFVDLFNTNNYTYATISTGTSFVFEFFRNNTFGSSYLMYLSCPPSLANVEYGWYTVPVDFGSISGSVYTDASETTPVTSGEAYLYREKSNFTKNDILVKTQLDANGNYKFDSIPYGEYRIAIRPNETNYPNSMITYFGDTNDWINATSIITTTTTSLGHKIHVKFHSPPAGSNNLSGRLDANLFISKSAFAASNPVPGVSIVVKKNPGSSARTVVTNTNGDFSLGALENGDYVLFVDIPGLHMTGTYSFNVIGNSVVNGLDFTVGQDSIHPFSSVIGIKEFSNKNEIGLNAYPNPYHSNAIIQVNVPVTSVVTLEAYNMIGEKIQTLENSKKDAGTYLYNFSATKLNLSTGMYIIKLTTGNHTKVLKLIEQ